MMKEIWCDCHAIIIKLQRTINQIRNMSDDEFSMLVSQIKSKPTLDLALFIRHYKKG